MEKKQLRFEQPYLVAPGSGELFSPQQSSAEVSRPGYHWGPEMPLPRLGDHSAAKHNIYSTYLEKYISTLTKRHVQSRLKMTVVDGFCGGGIYTKDGVTIDGSPLRLLTAVDQARSILLGRRGDFVLDVDFVFVDENRDHVNFLREELFRRGYGSLVNSGQINILELSFEDAVPGIISSIRRKGRAHHSLFFLDQYGWSDVKLATVRQIMRELANPEVILTFMVDALINLLHDKTSSISALAAIDYSREDVRALLKIKDSNGHKGWKRAIQNTVYKHIRQCTGADFYTPFFVHPPESHRDYWLIHLSKHHQAREEMGKVFWSANNTMEHFGGAGFDALGFDPKVDVRQEMLDFCFDDGAAARSKTQLLEQIPRLLHAEWKQGREVTKRTLFAARANDTPVVGSLVDSQLAELRKAGEVVIHGQKKDKAGNIVGETIRERSEAYGWDDIIRRPREPKLFSIFNSNL